MLIVLFILLIVCAIISQLTLRTFEKIAIDQFIAQVSLDIQQMQTLAMKEHIYTVIEFYDDNSYKGFLQNEYLNPTFEKWLPEGITFFENSTIRRISFNKYGDIAHFGKLVFFSPNGRHEIILNIEKGRLRIIEQ